MNAKEKDFWIYVVSHVSRLDIDGSIKNKSTLYIFKTWQQFETWEKEQSKNAVVHSQRIDYGEYTWDDLIKKYKVSVLNFVYTRERLLKRYVNDSENQFERINEFIHALGTTGLKDMNYLELTA